MLDVVARNRSVPRLLGGAAVLSCVAIQPLLACSLAPWWGSAYRPSGTVFLGRPLADTLEAGPGAVRYGLEPGHFGRPVDRTIYGQLVSVERLAAAVPAELRTSIRAAGDRVVLVPWDYDASCAAVPWARSARWLEGDERGVFEARLRDREHWVNDIPTLDVHAPQMVPYPAAIPRAAREAYVGPALSAEEMLDFIDALPTVEESRQHPPRALARLESWTRANPQLAARYPVRHMLDRARATAARNVVLAREVPVVGTYRFMMSTGKDSVEFFVRTRRTPTTVAHHLTRADLRRGMSDESRNSVGVFVLACAAATEASLPHECASRERTHQGYLGIADSASHDAEGRERRSGTLDFLRSFGRAAPLPGLLEMAREALQLGDALPDSEYHFFPGTFTIHPDGRVTFEQVILRDGVPAVHIRGERISRAVFER